MAALIFIGALIWGALSAQFLAQVISSCVNAFIYMAAIPFSKVDKSNNGIGLAVSVAQALMFGLLFFGGNWISGLYIDYLSFDATTMASLLSFLASLIYCIIQIPGKARFAKNCAWQPGFAERERFRQMVERIGKDRRQG